MAQQRKERRRYFKREARFTLRYNYFRMVLASVIIMTSTAGLNAVKNSLIVLLGFEYSVYALPLEVFFDLFILLFLIPTFFGYIYLSAKLVEGERIPAGGIFEYFSSFDGVLNCYRISCSLLVRGIAFIVPFLTIGIIISTAGQPLSELFPDDRNVDAIMICICIVFFAALFGGLIFMMRYFSAIYLFIKNPFADSGNIIKKSALIMKGHKFEAFVFCASFAVLVAISYLCGGLLFPLFTMPYIMLSYVSYMSFSYTEKDGDSLIHPVDEILESMQTVKKKSPAARTAVVRLNDEPTEIPKADI